ncbi:MAG: hypothetical protein RR429_13115 [Hafnia sp.]
MKKESEFSITTNGKESISERIRKLIGHRTVRAAAQDWGLPFSTLNNYLTRGTEPSLNVAMKVANIEGVSLEWLAAGERSEDEEKSRSYKADRNQPNHDNDIDNGDVLIGRPSETIEGALASAWDLIFEALSPDERYDLIHVFFKIGVRGALAQLKEKGNADLTWSSLTNEEKERLIALHEAKKGTPESSVGNNHTPPTQKKAG